MDLPDKIEEIRVSRFDKEQQLAYDTELTKLKKVLYGDREYNSTKMIILAEITKLRQICCDPRLIFDDYSGESAKLETCIDLVKSGIEAGHKILLFSQFTSMFDIISKRFEKENISSYVITGSTSKEKRIKLVNDFNNDDTNVFLISLKAGGTGLNLVGADIVIHYDPWWNFAAQNQATDRAHRIGQKNKVTVYRLIAKGTIEEKIVKLQETKKDLADRVLNFEEGVSLANISKEELLELLG
jgi:superfamily II DNA/RNA helicase, SNF2 family